MSRRDSLLAVLVMFVWGTNFVAVGYGLRDLPPFFFLAMRFALVCVPLVFFVSKPNAPALVIVEVGACLSLVQFGGIYLAIALGMPAGLTSLVVQAQVIFTIGLAMLVLHEAPSRRQAAGALVGTAGLIVVVIAYGATAPVVPLLIVLLAAGSWATGNVIVRRAGVSSGLSMVVWSALVVPVPSLLLSWFFEGRWAVPEILGDVTATALISTAFTAFGASLLGFAAWHSMLARYPTSAVVPFVLLVPPFGLGSAWLAFGEVPNIGEVVGGAVMLAGVAIATTRPWRRRGVDNIAPTTGPLG